MIVLDTNVVSDSFSKRPSEIVLNWMNKQELQRLFLSTVVLAELYFGAYLVQDRSRQQGLLQSIGGIRDEFAGRILGFGQAMAERYGQITAHRRLAGRPIETKDAMIAAICLVNDATLATRNVRDFDGLDLKLVNPFEAGE